MVDASDTVLPAEFIELLDQRHTIESLAVQGDRSSLLKIEGEIKRLVGRLAGIDRPGKSIGGRFLPGIFQSARLTAASPQVQIDAIRTLFSRFYGNTVLGCISDLFLAVHFPLADRRDDFQVGSQGLEGDVEADLIVAFTRTTVSYSHSMVL